MNLRITEMLLESILWMGSKNSAPQSPAQPGTVGAPGKLSEAQHLLQALVPQICPVAGRAWPLSPPSTLWRLCPPPFPGEREIPGPGTSQGNCQHRNLGKWQEPASPPWAGGRREINTNVCLIPVHTTGYTNLGNVFMGVRIPEFQSRALLWTWTNPFPPLGSYFLLCEEEARRSSFKLVALSIRDWSRLIKNSGSPVSAGKS